MTKITSLILMCAAVYGQRLNEIQVIGSHNSYHIGLAPNETAWLTKVNPKSAAGLDYQHPSLDVQFDNGVRQVEIDIYADVRRQLRLEHFGAQINILGPDQ